MNPPPFLPLCSFALVTLFTMSGLNSSTGVAANCKRESVDTYLDSDGDGYAAKLTKHSLCPGENPPKGYYRVDKFLNASPKNIDLKSASGLYPTFKLTSPDCNDSSKAVYFKYNYNAVDKDSDGFYVPVTLTSFCINGDPYGRSGAIIGVAGFSDSSFVAKYQFIDWKNPKILETKDCNDTPESGGKSNGRYINELRTVNARKRGAIYFRIPTTKVCVASADNEYLNFDWSDPDFKLTGYQVSIQYMAISPNGGSATYTLARPSSRPTSAPNSGANPNPTAIPILGPGKVGPTSTPTPKATPTSTPTSSGSGTGTLGGLKCCACVYDPYETCDEDGATEKSCSKWLNSQVSSGTCDSGGVIGSFSTEDDLSAMLEPWENQCGKIETKGMYHGTPGMFNTPFDTCTKFDSCVEDGGEVNFDTNSCMIFEDEKSADEYAATQNNPKRHTIRVSANQNCGIGAAKDFSHETENGSSRLKYVICGDGVVIKQLSPCQPAGTQCGADTQLFKENPTVKCKDTTGSDTTQKCCTDPSSSFGVWSAPGSDC